MDICSVDMEKSRVDMEQCGMFDKGKRARGMGTRDVLTWESELC